MSTPRFTRAIESTLKAEKLSLADVSPGILDVALDTLIEEDARRGITAYEFKRGVYTMVLNAARHNAGLRLHPDGTWE